MKKLLVVVLALLMAATMMVACNEKAEDTKPTEAPVEDAHPDAVAAAEELNAEAAEVLADAEEAGMGGKLKMYAEAKGTEIIKVVEIDSGVLELMGGFETLKEEMDANPFNNEEMTAKYPGVDKFTQILKDMEGNVIYTTSFTK